MAKWFGRVGYVITDETVPGVWTPHNIIHEYYGDVIKHNTRWSTNSDSTNDDLTVNTQISIVADPFANNYFHNIKWVEFMGARWKVTTVDPQPPRLILTLGVVYNGE